MYKRQNILVLEDHINMVTGKAIMVMKNIIKILCNDKIYKNSAKIAINLISSIINPILSYAWEACTYTAKDLEKLTQLQISTIKNILGIKRFTSNWGTITDLGIIPINIIIE